MNELVVKIEIISLDSQVKFEAKGELKNGRIKFLDSDGDLNYIIKHKDTLEYYKKGNIDMKYKFNLDEVTKGYYTIMNNRFEFDIVTNEMILDDDNIYIKYDLYQNGELINQTELKVVYQAKEESL